MNQVELFKQVWQSRSHICEVCNKHIWYPSPSNFAHIIAKGGYKQYKLLEENIALLCVECHHLYDHGDKSLSQFDKLNLKAEELRIRYYKEVYGKEFD